MKITEKNNSKNNLRRKMDLLKRKHVKKRKFLKRKC